MYFMNRYKTPERKIRYEVVKLLKFDPRRPLRKLGGRLGGWTNDFYRPMWLVECRREGSKQTHLRWIEAKRLREENRTKPKHERGCT